MRVPSVALAPAPLDRQAMVLAGSKLRAWPKAAVHHAVDCRFFTGRSDLWIHAMIEDYMTHYQLRVCPDIRDRCSGTRNGYGLTAGRGTVG